MASSNLPPGVTESMIPGNRPEDAAFEKITAESEIANALNTLADAMAFGNIVLEDVEVDIAEAIRSEIRTHWIETELDIAESYLE